MSSMLHRLTAVIFGVGGVIQMFSDFAPFFRFSSRRTPRSLIQSVMPASVAVLL